MKTLEYRTMDKTAWGPGVWQKEPDKIQWKDKATGLPCLMVRNHGGAWCGYVGVAEGHPLYACDYSGVAKLPKETLATMLQERGVADLYAEDLEKGDVHVEAILDAHGGITFASFCGSHTRKDWEKWRARKAEHEKTARQYSQGDSARFLREWADCFDNYDAWISRCEAVGICHVPEKGEPAKVWWFGFDCSHCDDIAPGYDALRDFSNWPRKYRDVQYVRAQVSNLAKQLKSLA